MSKVGKSPMSNNNEYSKNKHLDRYTATREQKNIPVVHRTETIIRSKVYLHNQDSPPKKTKKYQRKPAKSPIHEANPPQPLEETSALAISDILNIFKPGKSNKRQTEIEAEKEEIKAEFKQQLLENNRKAIIEEASLIDYRDCYRQPSEYFVKNSAFGKVYRVNKPKNNFIVCNNDPTLGGQQFQTPCGSSGSKMFSIISSEFDRACAKTPRSTYYKRIIPWDDKKKEYVYAALQENEFKGFFDRRSLKSRLRNITGHDIRKSSCFKLSQLLILIFIISIFIALIIVITLNFKDIQDKPFLYCIPFIAILIVTLSMFFIIRQGENSNNKKRFQKLNTACEDINIKYLADSGTSIHPGLNAAWLELDLDPRRTMIMGDPVRDRSEKVIQDYKSGYDANDESTREIYIKSVNSLDMELNNGHLTNSQVIRSRIIDQSVEIRNSPKKGSMIQNISKDDLNIGRHENFRQRLIDYKEQEKNTTNIVDCEDDDESGPHSARFGFVHPNQRNFSDKNLELNKKRMQIPSTSTSITSDYSNTNIHNNLNSLNIPQNFKQPNLNSRLDINQMDEYSNKPKGPNAIMRRITRKSAYQQMLADKFKHGFEGIEEDVNENLEGYQTNYDSVGVNQLSVTTFAPGNDQWTNDADLVGNQDTKEVELTFYQKLKLSKERGQMLKRNNSSVLSLAGGKMSFGLYQHESKILPHDSSLKNFSMSLNL